MKSKAFFVLILVCVTIWTQEKLQKGLSFEIFNACDQGRTHAHYYEGLGPHYLFFWYNLLINLISTLLGIPLYQP